MRVRALEPLADGRDVQGEVLERLDGARAEREREVLALPLRAGAVGLARRARRLRPRLLVVAASARRRTARASIRWAWARKSLGSGRSLGMGFSSPATSSMAHEREYGAPIAAATVVTIHPTGTRDRRPRRYARRVPRGDGRLTHDLDPHNPGPSGRLWRLRCLGAGEEVAKLTYFGLYALQHRGQEAAGIAVSDGSSVVVYKDLGLVSQVFDEADPGQPARLPRGRPHPLLDHRRLDLGERPADLPHHRGAGTGLALCHNGNLVNTAELAARAADAGVAGRRSRDQRLRPDHRADRGRPGPLRRGAGMKVLPAAARRLQPRRSWTRTPSTRRATRRASARWCSAGWSAAGSSPARPRRSTSSGASVVREVEPGELIAIDENGLRSQHFAPAEPKGCVFEYVYLARPDTTISGRGVHAARVEIGRRLAKEHPVEADLVIPVPESGTPAAVGYAEACGIPYGLGPGQELLRRPHLHPAEPDDPAARHPAEAQPAARRHPRQAARRRRRLDRPRQHPARADPDAARGGRASRCTSGSPRRR